MSKIWNHHSMKIPYILGVMSLFCAKSPFERVFLFWQENQSLYFTLLLFCKKIKTPIKSKFWQILRHCPHRKFKILISCSNQTKYCIGFFLLVLLAKELLIYVTTSLIIKVRFCQAFLAPLNAFELRNTITFCTYFFKVVISSVLW